MKILTVRVVNGRLDAPEGTLHEGDTVTLLVPEAETIFDLSQEETARLHEAIAEMERGEGSDGWSLLESLKD